MAAVTGKRKRDIPSQQATTAKKAASEAAVIHGTKSATAKLMTERKQTSLDQATSKLATATKNGHVTPSSSPTTHLQIVTGSYERVLHGIAARLPPSALARQGEAGSDENVTFADTFLFAAHASAIRCLAISPPTDGDSDKRYLATGSSDERINLYSLSTAPPQQNVGKPNLPSLNGTTTAENSRNRPVGSLVHHDRAITRLQFPAKSKLFSAAEDATIAISRTRDWTVLSSIKAPIPKPQGRPSGDTAGPGEIPTGVNDFAIHPSQKLMLSVGKGEKCMRLWNLMTGKKAGVLNFDRDLLIQVGEGKFSSGEGRRVLWDDAGENYVVGFERGAALFGIDSQPKAVIRPNPPSKIHQMHFLALGGSEGNVLAISTEDGRVAFFSTDAIGTGEDGKLPLVPCVSQLGGPEAGLTGRVKDFEILQMSPSTEGDVPLVVVTASSDGAVRLWTAFESDLAPGVDKSATPKQVGRLIATHETGERITCLGVFVLDGKVSDAPSEEPEEEEVAGAEQDEETSEESEDSDS